MTAKSDRATELLNDPLLREAFDRLREKYRDLIEEAPLASSEIEVIQDIRKMLHLLREVENDLYVMMQDGHYEDHRDLEKSRIN